MTKANVVKNVLISNDVLSALGARIDRNGCVKTRKRLPGPIPGHLIPQWIRNMHHRYVEDPESFAKLQNAKQWEVRRILRNYHLIPAKVRIKYEGILPAVPHSKEYKRLYMKSWRQRQ